MKRECAFLGRLLMVVFFVFMSFASVLPAQDLANSLFQKGMQLYAARDYTGAIDYLGQVCDMVPAHQQARYYLAYSMAASRNFEGAMKNVNILLQQDPANPQYASLKKQLVAQMTAARPAATAPNSSGRPGVPGKESVIESREDAWMRNASTARSLSKPVVPKKRTEIDDATDAIDMGNFAAAGKLLEAIIAKDPKNSKALHFRGVVESQQGHFAEAIPYYQKALAIKGDLFDTLFLLGDAQLKSGKSKEAEETFGKGVKLKQDIFAMINFAEAKKRNGKTKEALELYKQVLKLDGNSIDAKVNLAESLLDEGKIDEAVGMVNDALAGDSANSMAHYVKGRILLKSDLVEDAISQFKAAVAGSPDSDYYQITLAKTLVTAGKTAEAMDVANQILKRSADNIEARLLIAESLLAAGDLPNAEEHLKAIAASKEKNPRLTLLQARFARKSGDKDSAITSYKTYLGEDPSNGDAVMEFGGYLEELGEKSSAVDVYREVKRRFPDSSLSTTAQDKIMIIAPEAAVEAPESNKTKPEPGKVKY
ncbi:MAG: tetratricopeptide repeat protein [Candidatus Riflebacteria bacterium]|nr:tetratricopeptide repeat protein [Candidatus Riflebacteria bacterium]